MRREYPWLPRAVARAAFSGLLACLAIIGASAPVAAAEQRIIGVLAMRDMAEIAEAMQPTADYLSRALPDQHFVIAPLSIDELLDAVSKQSLDFVLADPQTYVLLETRYGLSRIATRLGGERGTPEKETGGVILVRADRRDLQELPDLRGRRIGVQSDNLLEGYGAQAMELLAHGVDPREDASVELLGGTQDDVALAVRSGRVDAGFVAAGVLEKLADSGRVRVEDFRVLGPKLVPGYPFLLSTALYPDWPFAVGPRTPEAVAKEVAVALLRMTPQSDAAKRASVQGWTLPMNYQRVHAVLRQLGLPPFDRPERFNLRDVVRKYDIFLVATLAAALLLVLLAGARYAFVSRSLAQRHRELQREARTRTQAERRLVGENQLLAMLARGVSRRQLFHALVHRYASEHPEDVVMVLLRDPREGRLSLTAALNLDDSLNQLLFSARSDANGNLLSEAALERAFAAWPGAARIIDQGIESAAGEDLGRLMVCPADDAPRDTDHDFLTGLATIAALSIEQTRALERVKLHATVVNNTLEAIAITDARGRILDANPALTQLTGYGRDELTGRSLGLLKSSRYDKAYYARILRQLLKFGHWRGDTWLRRLGGEEFPALANLSAVRASTGRISHFVAAFSDISEIKENESRLEHLANFDILTGLPNRTLLTDRFHQAVALAQRHDSMLAVCFVDLDHFKPVNDRHGHAAGDQLLTQVADRLREVVRSSDTVARLGGDEFVLLLSEIEGTEQLSTSLMRIVDEVSRPYGLKGGKTVEISASVGVTIYPRDNADPDTLLRHADQAMYQAKQDGRNRFHIFDPQQDTEVQRIVSRRHQMRNALDHQEFRLHYQPQIDMRSGMLIGVEALLRWQDPSHGLRSPVEFLPEIEHHEIICEIGDWVLREALRQQHEWAQSGMLVAMSINLSARHFLKPDFVKRLKALLREYPNAAGALELEIVETAALTDIPAVARVIRACQELGVQYALDDFGTGYSPLSYLRDLPIDTMKVDRSFIAGMLEQTGELAIVESVLGLAQAFRCRTIAEGIETMEHGVMLLRLGCHMGQGYAIAKPMPGDEVLGWTMGYKPPPAWLSWQSGEELRDFPLVMAEVEHRSWLRQILGASEGGTVVLPVGKIADDVRCRFGRWFHGQGRQRYGKSALYDKVKSEHEEVHRLGSRLIELIEHGERAEAVKFEQPLIDASSRMCEALARMQASGGKAGRPESRTTRGSKTLN